MTPELSDHEQRLRLLERQATEAAWDLASLKTTRDTWVPVIERLRHDLAEQEEAERNRKAALTFWEKVIGASLIFASPFVLLVAQHLLGWHS